jgi:hypothetical protein
MSLRKPVVASAAVIAALATTSPAASAATTAPAVRTASIGVDLGSGSLPCQILYWQLRGALLAGNTPWSNFLSNVFIYSHCGGAAI